MTVKKVDTANVVSGDRDLALTAKKVRDVLTGAARTESITGAPSMWNESGTLLAALISKTDSVLIAVPKSGQAKMIDWTRGRKQTPTKLYQAEKTKAN